MKLIKLIGIILLITILTSCRSENKNKLNEKTYPVIIVEFSHDKFHHSDTTTLTIRENDSINTHLFGLENDGENEIIMDMLFEINPNNESEILIFTIPAKLISKKEYNVGDKQFLVRKYYYDEEGVADEEGFFFTLDNRIIAFNSRAWNLYRFYKYENSNADLFLKNDTTDFFDYRNKKLE